MLPQVFLVAGMMLFAARAAPAPQPTPVEVAADTSYTTTRTVSATFTFQVTRTVVTTMPEITTIMTTTSSSSYKPTYTATEVYAFKPESPIHLLPFQAKGSIFRLADSPGIYCPSFVQQDGGCSMDSNFTGINGCSLSATVPGGQAVYLAPDGQLRFTQAHSQALYPPNSTICPLGFDTVQDSDAIAVSVHGFSSSGFMACPMLERTLAGIKQVWQIYANVTEMRPPLLKTNSSSCVNFEAVAFVKQLGHAAAAWQYI